MGKIPLEAEVWVIRGLQKYLLQGTQVFLHVKGYSLARVTHVDVEHELLNQIVPPRRAKYLPFKVREGFMVIALGSSYTVKLDGRVIEVNAIVIKSSELARILGRVEDRVYVGGKVGGIFLGFHKPLIEKLESYAVRQGLKPRRFSTKVDEGFHNSSSNSSPV